MKRTNWLLATIAALGLLIAGCEKKVDSSNFEQAFASASGPVKESANKAVAAIKAGSLKDALTALDSIKDMTNLPPNQVNAAGDLFVQVQQKVLANKALK